MTLKEKFDNIIGQSSPIEWEIECVQVADVYAIGFAEWLRENYYDNGELWTEWNSDDNTHSSKELLEIYKKEKGL